MNRKSVFANARFVLSVALLTAFTLHALEYPHATDEPQKTGWPLTPEERKYVVEKAEHDRRPGRESNQHRPELWPQVPTAGYFGGDAWLKLHEAHVQKVQAAKGPLDVLLVGDSITIQWADSWERHFPGLKSVNIGIGGDKTQNVLWRLDHGGVEGLQPKAIVLMIGNNNMFFTPETGIEAAAKGIQMCVRNLREKFPEASIVLAKILPAHGPGNGFYEDIRKTNAALDSLGLEADPKVRVLDLWGDFVQADGTLRKERFTPDNIHLAPAGYAAYAARLKPLLDSVLVGRGLPSAPPAAKAKPAAAAEAPAPAGAAQPKAAAGLVLKMQPVLKYPYAPYEEGKLDPQRTGWPLTEAELAWVAKGEYERKPGHESHKHMPDMWFVTPTASHWKAKDGSGRNLWIEHHAECLEKVQAMNGAIDIALLGDSITQGWGGGWDGAPFSAAWQQHFGGKRTVNLGIGGDRAEQILWRLDHGALEGASPKVVVLKIGVNNAPLVEGNGVPVAAAVQAIQLCVENIRRRCPDSKIVLVKILPAFDPSGGVGARVLEINAGVEALKLDTDSRVRVLDLTQSFLNTDGTLKKELYSDGHLHLGPKGYEVFAAALKPVVEGLLH
jgi:platelet-activating factor acetylhydrolase IB subunit beta/gamma